MDKTLGKNLSRARAGLGCREGGALARPGRSGLSRGRGSREPGPVWVVEREGLSRARAGLDCREGASKSLASSHGPGPVWECERGPAFCERSRENCFAGLFSTKRWHPLTAPGRSGCVRGGQQFAGPLSATI